MNAVNIRRGTWLVVILLPFVAGGIQRKSFIGALSATGGWLFYEEDHQLFLIEGKAAAQQKFERQVISRWTISAPTVRTLARGQLLSVDPDGESERVRLDFKKGGHTEWNLHVESRENPKRAG